MLSIKYSLQTMTPTRWGTGHLLSAHRAKETVDLLKRETPDFIPPSRWPRCAAKKG